MKLRESLAVGSLVVGASLGMSNEGCVYSAYPQGKPGAVQPSGESVAAKQDLDDKLGGMTEVGDAGNPLIELEDPFDVVCNTMNSSINYVIDGKRMSMSDCDENGFRH